MQRSEKGKLRVEIETHNGKIQSYCPDAIRNGGYRCPTGVRLRVDPLH